MNAKELMNLSPEERDEILAEQAREYKEQQEKELSIATGPDNHYGDPTPEERDEISRCRTEYRG